MGLLSKLFGQKPAPAGARQQRAPVAGPRPGTATGRGPAFTAWTSGDLQRMLGSVNEPCHPVDRHFLLMNIVNLAYKRRKKDPCMRDLCEHYARIHLGEFPNLAQPLANEMGGNLPRVPTFQHLATLLAEAERYSEAVEVCQLALQYGLHDGTKGGFEGRIARIRKKGGLE